MYAIRSYYEEIYLDNMLSGLFDLKSLGSSFEGTTSLMYLINGSVKGIDGYIKRLIDRIRMTLKKNDLKASKTKIARITSYNVCYTKLLRTRAALAHFPKEVTKLTSSWYPPAGIR